MGIALPVMAGNAVPIEDDTVVAADELAANAKAPVVPKEPTSVKLKAYEFAYSGKVITPTVIAKDGTKTIPKKYYTIKNITNCKNVGDHKITVTFKGNYKGEETLEFTILPKATKIKSLKADSSSITVKYDKQAKEATGYDLLYGTSSNRGEAEPIEIKSAITTSKVITGLEPGTKYYFWIRTVKGDYESAWSSPKSIKTKGKSSGKDLDPKTISLPYDTISKKVTINGKEFSKYTYNEFKDYLTSYPGAKQVKDSDGDIEVILTSGGKDFILGEIYENETSDYKNLYIYLKGGSRIYSAVQSDYTANSYVKRFSTKGVDPSQNHDFNKKMEVTSFIKSSGSTLFDTLQSGLFKLLSGYDRGSVINIKGANIKTLTLKNSISPASAGLIRLQYDNSNKEISLNSDHDFSSIRFTTYK